MIGWTINQKQEKTKLSVTRLLDRSKHIYLAFTLERERKQALVDDGQVHKT